MSWNSTIAEYDSSRKVAAKHFINRKGDIIEISSGSLIVKSIICKFSQDFGEDVAVLVSNVLTHYDIDPRSRTVLKEFSPLHCFQLKAKAGDKAVFDVDNSVCIKYCEVDEITFQLMTLSKRKIDVNFSVHFFYNLNN